MNILLIQPPDPALPDGWPPSNQAEEGAFSPPWNLLCLRAYLFERTRHIGHLLDARLYSNLEIHLREAIAAIPPPRLAVVNTSTIGLGQTSAVLEIIHRYFPGTRALVVGDHPSQYPEHALISREDFAAAGDPEPILRSLLDYMDVPQRLERTPGLLYRNRPPTEPYWLPSLKGLALPGWDGIFWPAYARGPAPGWIRAELRLSRGHTHLTTDRACGGHREPLREHLLDQVALSMQKSLGAGVNEIFVADPPGYWTLPRLSRWCSALTRCHNMQMWSLQLLPANLKPETVDLLKDNQCRRVEFVIPSSDAETLERYHCTVTPRDLVHTVELLARAGIRSHLRFWLGGPEEPRGEVERVVRAIRTLGYCSYTLAPYPFRMDAPVYEELADVEGTPTLEEWIQWARDPWLTQRPLPCYGGEPRARYIAREITRIQATIGRSPGHLLKKMARHLVARNWIEVMEQKAAGFLARYRPAKE
jgi:hypothetical protein